MPVTDPRAFVEVDVASPRLHPRDLLVAVRAVSVDPGHVKRRAGTGPEVEHYRVGDPVHCAGDVSRQGSDADHQAVDERIVAPSRPPSATRRRRPCR